MLSVLALSLTLCAPQWEMVKKDQQHPDQAHVLIDVGFVVSCRRLFFSGRGGRGISRSCACQPPPAKQSHTPLHLPVLRRRSPAGMAQRQTRRRLTLMFMAPAATACTTRQASAKQRLQVGPASTWLAWLVVQQQPRGEKHSWPPASSACQPVVACPPLFLTELLSWRHCAAPLPCTVTSEGGQGPWKACFRVSKGQVRGLLACLCQLRGGCSRLS